jgi:hypothetical protein
MLTFISGWRSIDRDRALINYRDPARRALFFIENGSNFPDLLPDAPIVDVWRHGPVDFKVGSEPETLIQINHDTEFDVLRRAVTHVLLSGADAQVIVTYDAIQHLYRLFPALRAAGALLAADERLDAPAGDRVLFTRGGSFVWTDHLIETQTSLLTNAEVLDAGVVPTEDEESG